MRNLEIKITKGVVYLSEVKSLLAVSYADLDGQKKYNMTVDYRIDLDRKPKFPYTGLKDASGMRMRRWVDLIHKVDEGLIGGPCDDSNPYKKSLEDFNG